MNDIKKLRIAFEPNYSNINMVRAAVRGICADFFLLSEETEIIMDFCLIVTELMNNAVEHAHCQEINIELSLTDHEATFCLISDGNGFDPTQRATMPEIEADELPEGGYGLAIIQALADDIEYECLENKNMVTLRKSFPRKEEKERY